MNLPNQDILEFAAKYDEEHPWWAKKEKELGDKLRETGELTKEDLIARAPKVLDCLCARTATHGI